MKQLFISIFAIVLGIIATTITVFTTAYAKQIVNFGVQPATHPIYISRELGMIEKIEKKHNVKFEWHRFSYGAPENQALAAGELQIATAGMGPAIIASVRLPAKLLAITVLDQTAVLVPVNSEVKTIADLKGKTIGHPGKGSQQYPLMVKALTDAGLSVNDVKLFKTKASDIATLVSREDLDAGIIWDPHVSKALVTGQVRILKSSGEIMPIKSGHYVGNGVYAREDFIEANPELVQDIVNTLVVSIDYIIANPKKSAKLWAKATGLPEKVLNYSVDNKISVFDRDITPSKKTVDAYMAFLKGAGILKPGDVAKYDSSFAEKALAQ